MLSPKALTTIDRVRRELSLEADAKTDALLADYINESSDEIASRCSRVFAFQESIVENVKGFGTMRLMVRALPIIAIASIQRDGEIIDAASYFVEDPEAGLIRSLSGSWSHSAASVKNIVPTLVPSSEALRYRVEYSGGYVTPQQEAEGLGPRTLPGDLERAVIAMVVARYRSRGRDLSVKSKSALGASVSFAGENESGTAQIIDSIVARYSSGGVA